MNKIAVIGLGYVGLPLLLEFIEKRFRVIGFDVDSKKPETLQKGETYIICTKNITIWNNWKE